MEKELIIDEAWATLIAESLGGEAWHSGGDIWLVLLRKESGAIVAISDDVVCEYDSEDDFNDGHDSNSIELR